ncbi:hypothetical protein N3K66_003921 [Trichothecium roseum]|uniref:Uncharacterized protein n=1 Tax=Trichothecium roseum TaxID=47278 RepID=A0ACC0V8R0_9HYPO|nr:hypothetical protein N3K66_003921 [Trichothecium roseum]
MLSILQDWVPPSRENWRLTVNFYQYVFPVFGSFQWFLKWYGMGKTSVASSPLNIPGRAAWLTMEIVGPAVFLTSVLSASSRSTTPLPWQNKFLAGLYLLHYAYRAVAFPFVQPSMSPIHLLVWSSAVVHQFCNGTSLGGWLGGLHGPASSSISSSPAQFLLGVTLFLAGLAGNFYHDEALREIRRREARRQHALRNQPGVDRRSSRAVDKHYRIPEAGLFRYVLYPHYLCEWVEWLGFWVACGWPCVPARAFLLNEVFAMLPRAVNGRRWYADKFGEEKIRGKWAVIPGLI